MKVEEFDGKVERAVLIDMIVNDSACGRIGSKWNGEMFRSSWANIVGKWCVEYHSRFGKAPGKKIQSIYEVWTSSDRHDTTQAKMVELLISSLSDEYQQRDEETNPEFSLGRAIKHFNEVKLRKLCQMIEGELSQGNIDSALGRVTDFSKIEFDSGNGVFLFQDIAAMESTFSKEMVEPLLQYPGGMGNFFAGQLSRDSFLAFMGPEKMGKSWWLLDLAWRAMTNRKRVAYFQIGDLSAQQIYERFMVRANKALSESNRDDTKWPCVVKWPINLIPPMQGQEFAVAEFEEYHFDKPFQMEQGWAKATMERVEKITKSKKPFFHIEVYPTRSISVPGIRSRIDAMILGGYVPDVVIIDYADILMAVDHRADELSKIKRDWEEMRKLSQMYHCLLVTATQVNAASYGKRLLDRSNFSGNHLKLAEVTGMVAINVTSEEKETQVMRLNWVARRKGAYSPRRVVHVANCLDLAAPCVLSYFEGTKQLTVDKGD